MNKMNKGVLGAETARELYYGSVADRALKRAGHCKNLKGHIHEIMFKDQYNSNVKNIVAGRKAYLTNSPIAKRDDIVVKNNNGRIVKRYQCKDTCSTSGVNDTVKRIGKKQYAGTNVVGTKETAEKVNKSLQKKGVKTSTKVKSSNISSKTTALIACQANGANPLKNLGIIGHHAKQTSKKGAVVGFGISAIKNAKDVHKGKKEVDEAVVHVATDTGKAGASAGIASAVDVSVTMAVAATPLAPVAKPIGIAAGIGTGVLADKTFKAFDNRVSKGIDKIADRRLSENDKTYAFLKSNELI